jgi:hypothetical protein
MAATPEPLEPDHQPLEAVADNRHSLASTSATGELGAFTTDNVPITAFNALLRSLISWELVVRDDGDGRWQLTEHAQRQLDAVVPIRPADGDHDYIDHICSRCHERHLTRLRGDRYLCIRCERADLESSGRRLDGA